MTPVTDPNILRKLNEVTDPDLLARLNGDGTQVTATAKPSVYQNVYDAFTMETGRPEPADTVKAITERNLPVMPPPAPISGITRPFKAQAFETMKGYHQGIAGFAQRLDDIATFVSDKTGLEKGGLFGEAAKFYSQNADYWDRRAKEVGVNAIDEMVGSALGGAIPGITEFALNVPYSAMTGAAEAHKKGTSELAGAITEGVKRFTLGQIFHMAGQLKQPLSSLAQGGTMALQTAGEGGSPSEIAKSFGVGTLYGATSPGGNIGVKEIMGRPEVNIADQLPRSVWPYQKTGGAEVPTAPVREAGRMIDVPKGVIPSVQEETSKVSEKASENAKKGLLGQTETPAVENVPPVKSLELIPDELSLLAHYKAKGLPRYKVYDQFIRDTKIDPENIKREQLISIYDSLKPLALKGEDVPPAPVSAVPEPPKPQTQRDVMIPQSENDIKATILKKVFEREALLQEEEKIFQTMKTSDFEKGSDAYSYMKDPNENDLLPLREELKILGHTLKDADIMNNTELDLMAYDYRNKTGDNYIDSIMFRNRLRDILYNGEYKSEVNGKDYEELIKSEIDWIQKYSPRAKQPKIEDKVPEPPKPQIFEHPEIKPTDKINAITREQAGHMIADEDPAKRTAVIPHIIEGVAQFGKPAMQDAIRNQEMIEIAKAHKGAEREAVKEHIQQIEPEINKALTGKSGNIGTAIGNIIDNAKKVQEIEPKWASFGRMERKKYYNEDTLLKSGNAKVYDFNDNKWYKVKDAEDYRKKSEDLAYFISKPAGEEKTWYRYGNIPESYRSINYTENKGEMGVSVYSTPKGSSPFFADREIYTGKGRQVGWGSDGEPIIIPTGKWSKIEPEINKALTGQGEIPKPIAKEPWPETVQRIEEPNIPKASFDKPHGIYATPGNVESPHADLGGDKHTWKINPNAKLFDIPEQGNVPIRKGALDSGAGVHAAKYFLGDTFNIIKAMNKPDLIKWATEHYSKIDFSKYYDRQEIIEAIGALEAKKQGIDAFRVIDKSNPQFTEIVLLSPNATVQETPIPAPKPTIEPIKIQKSIPKLTPSQRKTLELARNEIASREMIKNQGLKDTEGYYTGETLTGASMYPEWFKNKGYTKEGTLKTIDQALSGKPLTPKQQLLIEDINQGIREEYAKGFKESRKTGEVAAWDLKEGDKLKRAGEVYTVKKVDDAGLLPEVTIKNSDTITLKGDETLKYDRGTLKKGEAAQEVPQPPQPKAILENNHGLSDRELKALIDIHNTKAQSRLYRHGEKGLDGTYGKDIIESLHKKELILFQADHNKFSAVSKKGRDIADAESKYTRTKIANISKIAPLEFIDNPSFISFKALSTPSAIAAVKKLKEHGYDAERVEGNYIKIIKGEVAPAPPPPEVYTGEHMTEAGMQNVWRGKGFDAAMPTTKIKTEAIDLNKLPLFAGEQKPETEVQQGMFGTIEPPPAPDKITEMHAGIPTKEIINYVSKVTAPITNDLHNLFSPATKTELSQEAAGIIRERNAKLAQNREQLYKQLGEFRKQFNNMTEKDQIKYINDYETGQAKDKFGQFAQQELAKWWKQIQAIKGTDKFIEDYWPHFWEKGNASIWQRVFGKRPLQGPATFLRKRTIPTIQDGIDAGLKPVTTNPVDMAFLKIGEMQRFVMGHDIWQEYKDKGLVQFVRYNQKWPEGWNQINDKIATVSGGTKVPVKIVLDEIAKGTKYNLWKAEFSKRIFEDTDMKEEIDNLEAHKGRPYKSYSEIVIRKFISDPESFKAKAPKIYDLLKEVSDGKPELEMLWDIPVFNDEAMKLPVGGRIKKGEYFAPEPVARILNNFLSPGLRGNALYDTARGIGNTMNQVQLGISLYHLTFTSLDSVISKYALGMQELGRGQFGKAAQHLSPHNLITAPFTNYLRGSKVLNEYFSKNPSGTEISNIVDAGIKGGFRVKMDNFYKNSSVESFWNAIHQGKYGIASVKTIPAALEYMAKPLMEHIVPRMKAGVFSDMAKSQMDLWEKQGHIPTTEEQRAVYGKLWDSVDNRMGQLVYDNLFWNKTLKDIGMLTTRSLGWNLGAIRELTGGIKDVKDIKVGKKGITISPRTAYLIALPAITAIYGAVIHYLYTGNVPDDLKDYYFPKTGRTLPDGREERVTLPTYMKDIFAYKEHPLLSIGHKVHPLISATIDMINNKDFYNTEIRNPEDPLVKQVQQDFEYMAKQFVPFSVRNTQQRLKAGGGIPEGIESFFGLIPAPGYVTRSPAEQVMYDYISKHMPQVITQEEAKQKQLKYDIRGTLRQGKSLTSEQKQQAMELGKRKFEGIIKTKLSSFQNHFKSLNIDTAIKTWKVATPEERKSVQGIYGKKIDRAISDNPAMKKSILQKIQEAK